MSEHFNHQTPNDQEQPGQTGKQDGHPIEIVKVNARNGIAWLREAFKLFTSQLKAWLGITSFLFVLLLIPGINQIIALLFPIPIAGVMLGCRQLSPNTPLTFDHLFAALKTHVKPLIYLCAFYGLASIILTILTYMIMQVFGYDIFNLLPEKLNHMSTEELMGWLTSIEGVETSRIYALTGLIYLALLIPVMMAFWFAPALIVLENSSPVNALKLSLSACKINVIPFTLYGLAGVFYLVIAFTFITLISVLIPLLSIPLVVLLFLTIFAVSIASIYTSYMDIFISDKQKTGRQSNYVGGMIA
ncbi:MAG: BPSS1780 family membrane protein [Kangiellaceae bacterium]